MHQSVNKGDDASRVRKHFLPLSDCLLVVTMVLLLS